jgi:hypothetical protein
MRHYKPVIKVQDVHDCTTCDICGKEFKTSKSVDACSVEHKFEMSYDYSEYYYDPVDSYHWAPDICMDCFIEKFVPFFEQIGLVPPPNECKYDASFDTAIALYLKRRQECLKN